MSDILSREFVVALFSGARIPSIADLVALDKSDAALRAIIQRAVEDVERLAHFGICHARDMSACHNGADRECEWMVARCRTHKPEAFACSCGHDAAIARMKEGLGE